MIGWASEMTAMSFDRRPALGIQRQSSEVPDETGDASTGTGDGRERYAMSTGSNIGSKRNALPSGSCVN